MERLLFGDSNSKFSTRTWKDEFPASNPYGKNPNTGSAHPIQDQLGAWMGGDSCINTDDMRLALVELFKVYHKSAASITASGSPQTKSLPVTDVM
jgi:hypothetical protein